MMDVFGRLQHGGTQESWPFSHAEFKNFLSTSDFEHLQAAIFDISRDYVTVYNPGYEDCYEHEEIFCLNSYRKKEKDVITEFLSGLASENSIRSLLRRFDMSLDGNYSLDFNLHREFAGFIGLSPHTDLLNSQNKKILNFFLYLSAAEDCPEEYGTKLIEGNADDYDIEKLKVVPYAANTALSFPITENSWHMVDPLRENCRRRDVLVMRIIEKVRR